MGERRCFLCKSSTTNAVPLLVREWHTRGFVNAMKWACAGCAPVESERAV